MPISTTKGSISNCPASLEELCLIGIVLRDGHMRISASLEPGKWGGRGEVMKGLKEMKGMEGRQRMKGTKKSIPGRL